MIYIHFMNLASLDLNLLVALDALLREASVSRAAMRIGLSQPAATAAMHGLAIPCWFGSAPEWN